VYLLGESAMTVQGLKDKTEEDFLSSYNITKTAKRIKLADLHKL